MAHCPPQGSSEHKNGRTWVDKNHELKRELIKGNGGVMPYTPAFTTSSHEFSDQWSEEFLPPILFYLVVPKSIQFDKIKKVKYLLDDNGQSKHRPGDTKRKVRDFNHILPERIAIDVPGWMIEAWRRYDPRIQYHDILDRMTTDLGEAQELTKMKAVAPSPNSLSNHANRNCRLLLHHFSSWGRRNEPHHTEITAIENLTLNNFMDNTVLRRGPDGKFVRVKFTHAYAGSNIQVELFIVTDGNYDRVTFDADYFVKDLPEPPQINENINNAMNLLLQLQERAVAHGLQPEEWEKIPNKCKPASWHDRKGRRQVDPDETEREALNRVMLEYYEGEFDGGCEVCSWVEGQPTNWSKYEPNADATTVPNKFAWTTENEVVPRGPAKRRSKKVTTKTGAASTTTNNNNNAETSSTDTIGAETDNAEQFFNPVYIDRTELPITNETFAAENSLALVDPALINNDNSTIVVETTSSFVAENDYNNNNNNTTTAHGASFEEMLAEMTNNIPLPDLPDIQEPIEEPEFTDEA